MRGRTFAAALLLAACIGKPLPGQERGEREQRTEMVTAAVRHVLGALQEQEGVPAGPVGFDPRVVRRWRMRPRNNAREWTFFESGPARDSAETRRLLDALSAARAHFDSAQVCPGEDPRRCRLRDGRAAVLAAGEPETSYLVTATVLVKAVWQTRDPERPVRWGWYSVSLRRDGERWRVHAMETLSRL